MANNQTQNPAAIFPDLPRAQKIVDENGNLDPLWGLGLSALFQALQQNFRNDGIMFPRLSEEDIASIEAAYVPYINSQLPVGFFDASGMTVYDINNYVSKQFVIVYNTSVTPATIVSASWKIFQFV